MTKRLRKGTRVEYRQFDIFGGTRTYATGKVTGSWHEDGESGYFVTLDNHFQYTVGRNKWAYDAQISPIVKAIA